MGTDTGHIDVAIDAVAWTRTGDIRWPSATRHVHFIHAPAGAGSLPCLEPGVINAFFASTPHRGLRIGEACGDLAVLFEDRGVRRSAGADGIAFAAHHEAFHLAAQLYGMRVPLEYLTHDRDTGAAGFSDFFADFAHVDPGNGSRPSRALCKFLATRFDALPAADREHVNALAYWEWPAEYYAFLVMSSGSRRFGQKYAQIRRGAGSEAEYAPSIAMGRFLDRAMGREAWQAQLANGASMLDVAATLCDPSMSLPSRTLVRVNRMDLFPSP